MRFGLLVLMLIVAPVQAQPLQVSPDGHRLQHADGTPFFYLGDTAWELFHRLDRNEARRFLEHRAGLGFNVIQAVVLAQLGGLDVPNPYGAVPLLDRDPTRPNEAYFEHVDAVVEMADSLGLFVGLLPTWGSYWRSGDPADVIFTPANARVFGRFLGDRYKEKPIIWILGGDQDIHTAGEREVIDAMAAGLEEGMAGRHLITFHPRGPGLSSQLGLHEAPWLDFHMVQSSHGSRDHDNGLYADHDYALTPPKPTLDGEPRYEGIPVGFYFRGNSSLDRFDDYDARQAAYWSVFAGAAGHTYGNNNIWQMWAPGREPIIGANIPWYEAIHHPGARQMGHLKQLMLSLPFNNLVPNREIVVDGPSEGGGKIRAMTSKDGSVLVAYSPRGEAFSIDKRMLMAGQMTESWFDPRYGVTYDIHTSDTKGIQTFTPPTSGRGQDWVLVITSR